MELTIFAIKRTNNEGRKFINYISRLKRKNGTEQSVRVKFREECGEPKPESCPMNIVVEKNNANMSVKTYTDNNGELQDSYILWVSAWKQGKPYVDHSLDEYDV